MSPSQIQRWVWYLVIKASARSPKSQERYHHVDDVESGPSEHLQADTCCSPHSNRSLRLDVKFNLNLDFPALSCSFMGRENKKEEVKIQVDVLERGVLTQLV